MTIKFNKRTLVAAAVLAIIAIIYNVIFFVVPFPDMSKAARFITYGCTMFSFVLALIIFAIAFGGEKPLSVRILSVPIIYVAYSLAIAQSIFDIIVMWWGSFLEFKPWVAIVVETILIGASLIALILKVAYRNMIVENEKKDVSKESFIQELRVEVDAIVNENKDELLSKDLHKLQDYIKYTTPVSNNSVVQLENEIIDLINELRSSKETEKSRDLIEKITNLLKERKIRLQE